MKKIYHLSTCDTCRKILAKVNTKDVELVNIREQNIQVKDLDLLKDKAGSYEALFNKRAQKYKQMSEDAKPVKDQDYKKLILSEYTFLKRPAAIVGDLIFVGNDKDTVEGLITALSK